MDYRIKYRCPCDGCDSTAIDERMVSVVQFSEVVAISGNDNSGVTVDYGLVIHEDGEVVSYQCARCDCNHIIAQDSESLLEWLREHDMLEEITDTTSLVEIIVALIENNKMQDEALHETILDCSSGIGANMCNSIPKEQAEYLIEQFGFEGAKMTLTNLINESG